MVHFSPMPFPEGLESIIRNKCKETLTPPGVAKRNSWGPILFKHCRVQYNKKTKKLELMKGEFVGKYKIARAVSLGKDTKCENMSNDDDDDDDDDEDDDVEDDEVDNDDPGDVVADNILPGLCFLF